MGCSVYSCDCGWVLLVRVQQCWAIHRSYTHCSYGGIWQMGLKKTDNNIWFCNGWQDFVEYHSICYGYLLVFRFEGNSSFHVLIFDKTATKIQNPPNKNCKLEDHQVEIIWRRYKHISSMYIPTKHEVREKFVMKNFSSMSRGRERESNPSSRKVQA